MQSIASVANRFSDDMVAAINPKHASESGCYSIKIYSHACEAPFYILVDDYLPTQDGIASGLAGWQQYCF